ncbi:MAG TPA: TRAP transporter substrate-binding protein DctP [Burkholderiaceae bacterium]|nr:TRAP transporter substrate-binding protein DctP [Burkholderiaceae bacterium]
MTRRVFLERSALATAGAGMLAAPAIVRAQPTIRWRIASSFPKSLDALFGGAETIARRVAALTDGKFQITTHAAGEIVPGLQVLDAVQQGSVEMGHTALYYFYGKDPTWALATAIPFGLNTRQYNAWWHQLGGAQVFNTFAQKAAGITCMLAGNTGAQMGGWFRREINSLDELKGLKFRIAGFAGEIFAKLGAVPQQLAGGDIYPALEKGTIDAAEWVGPYDDEKLGFVKVAKYYYYPGFWEGCAAIHGIVNDKALASLPPAYRAALEAACEEAHAYTISRYDAFNAQGLKRLIAAGAVLKAYPRPVMEAGYKAAQEIYAATSAKNAEFKKIFDHYFSAQRDLAAWFRVTENTFDDFIAGVRR